MIADGSSSWSMVAGKPRHHPMTPSLAALQVGRSLTAPWAHAARGGRITAMGGGLLVTVDDG